MKTRTDEADNGSRTTTLLPVSSAPLVTDLLEGEIAAARAYRRRAKADNTVRAYASDWRQFAAGAMHEGLSPGRPDPS